MRFHKIYHVRTQTTECGNSNLVLEVEKTDNRAAMCAAMCAHGVRDGLRNTRGKSTRLSCGTRSTNLSGSMGTESREWWVSLVDKIPCHDGGWYLTLLMCQGALCWTANARGTENNRIGTEKEHWYTCVNKDPWSARSQPQTTLERKHS